MTWSFSGHADLSLLATAPSVRSPVGLAPDARSHFVFCHSSRTAETLPNENASTAFNSCAPTVEAVGAFEDLRLNDKGLATVSTDTGFECHVKLAEVKSAAFVAKDSGDKTLHIVRLLDEQKKSLLSAILSPETPGDQVEEGAIEYWTKLKQRFGDEVELAQG